MTSRLRVVRDVAADLQSALTAAGVYELTDLSTAVQRDGCAMRLALALGTMDPIARETLRAEAIQTFAERKLKRGAKFVDGAIAEAKRLARDYATAPEPPVSPADARPEITIGELHKTTDAAIAALAKLDVYQRAGKLVDVIREAQTQDDGAVVPADVPRIRRMPSARLNECLHQAARW
ncbi:MAG TPA: hypothetical protein VF331_00805 [Polyangiales bacterium]